MDIQIKHAEPEDYKLIAKLSNQLGYKSTEDAIKERISKLLSLDLNCIFVAVFKGNLVGWIHGFQTHRVESDSFIEIGGLVVEKDHRDKGIGKLLVLKLQEWAQTTKCSSIRVRCNVTREGSDHFYKKLGFALSKKQNIFDKVIG